MNIGVEYDVGKLGIPEPRAFFLGNQRLEVEEVIDRWPSEDYTYVKLRTDDGAIYILRHAQGRPQDEKDWQLVLYQSPHAPLR